MSTKSRVAISGLGQLSASGQGVESFMQALSADQPLLNGSRDVQTANGLISVGLYQAPDPALPEGLPESVKRRMARFSKMCFAAMNEALSDAFGSDDAAVDLRGLRGRQRNLHTLAGYLDVG